MTKLPPPPPRPIPPDAFRRWLSQDALAIISTVFALLGLTFILLGAFLMFVLGITPRLDLILFLIGSVFLSWSVPLWGWRYLHHRQELRIWAQGEAVPGYITQVIQNRAVRINRRHPWLIHYRFSVLGQPYDGHASRWNIPQTPDPVGQPLYVLYLPDDPQQNTIYERE